ncbi:hypothetical protein LEP1GSC052_3840 [Leptospira kmetyi serovar Malaysia str. Bejo-Iso9]|nr:hypothetical protein LEP1GSC052_3840 [Leptospira kmetyi serovar Malaysia str. Bejo-Iso9]
MAGFVGKIRKNFHSTKRTLLQDKLLAVVLPTNDQVTLALLKS